MHIQDAFAGVPEFAGQARYIAGHMTSDTRSVVENGIHNALRLVGNMRMRAGGAFPGRVTTDSADLTRAAECLEGMIAVAQHRLQTGGLR